MATAVEPTSEPRRTPNPRAGLVAASLAGAVYVLAALAVVFYLVPQLWVQAVTPVLGPRLGFGDAFLRWTAQVAATLALVRVGQGIAGANPPKGLRGGIFLVISAAITVFFVVRAVGLNVEELGVGGQAITGAVGVALLVGLARFFATPRAERWMIAIEEMGWLHTSGYKRALGLRVRRLTILGVLLVGGSGVYALYSQGQIARAPWGLELPFTDARFVVMDRPDVTVLLLLLALTFWVAFRLVNVPTFAEFLIATEAEMNKVSWSTRRRLTQDTIVVLTTTVLMTLFLLGVDLFWGWLLSREIVGVLPGKSTEPVGKAAQQVRW